jgi:hypothetical protein
MFEHFRGEMATFAVSVGHMTGVRVIDGDRTLPQPFDHPHASADAKQIARTGLGGRLAAPLAPRVLEPDRLTAPRRTLVP